MLIRTKEGNEKDVAITEVNAENYIVPSNERHLYHCIIEVRKFDSETGKRLSRPRVQKFDRKVYESGLVQNLKRQGYTIEVLHNPNEYLAEQRELQRQKAEERATALAEAKAKKAAEEQARIDAAVEAALARQAEEHKKAIDEAVKKALAQSVAEKKK